MGMTDVYRLVCVYLCNSAFTCQHWCRMRRTVCSSNIHCKETYAVHSRTYLSSYWQTSLKAVQLTRLTLFRRVL